MSRTKLGYCDSLLVSLYVQYDIMVISKKKINWRTISLTKLSFRHTNKNVQHMKW